MAARLSPAAAGLPDPDVMVLQIEDLPGFQLRQTFHMRTGMADRGTPWADRVRDRRGRSTRAYFERESADLTSIASMAIPLADRPDAEAASPIVPERLLTNPDPGVHVLARETLGTAGAPASANGLPPRAARTSRTRRWRSRASCSRGSRGRSWRC